jgi:hypothetical protein
MSERKKNMTQTTYSDKCFILGDLWLSYRDDEQFKDFVEYNDLGLPLAYAISANIVESTDLSKKFVEESFDLLLAGLGLEDTGFEGLDDLLDASESN